MFAIIFCMPFGFGAQASSTASTCDMCESMLAFIADKCFGMGNCTEEEMVSIMETAALSLPAVLRAQAEIFIQQYGIALAQLYNLGQGESACEVLGVCSSGGGEDPCPDCTDCSSTSWAAIRPGYESRVSASCNCGVCEKNTLYRCAAGYYGYSETVGAVCKACPKLGSVAGKSNAGSTLITDCFVPSGTTGSETAGNFIYTANCYYSN